MISSNRSEITPDLLAREIRVLVLGSYETALKPDAFLSLDKHKVTTSFKASAGLCMIQNGRAFDCVLLDYDECDVNLKYFVHQSLNILPDLKIIVMAPNVMPKEFFEIALHYKAVWLRVKPCGIDGISNVIGHIIKRKMEFLRRWPANRFIKRTKYSNFPNLFEGWNPRGIENAYPNRIPAHMNVPCLSRYHVASHPQFQVGIERGRVMREPVILLPERTNQNLNRQDNARQRLGLLASSHCDASTSQGNSLQPSNLNSIGSLTMHVDSIRSILQQNSSSSFQVLNAATSGGRAPDHSYINLLHQAPGETSGISALKLDENPHRGIAQGSQAELQDQDFTQEIDTMVTAENYSLPNFGEVRAPVESQYNLGAYANCVSNGFNNSNLGGACGFSKAIPTLDVGATLRSQYNPGVIPNDFSNGVNNSYSGGASGSGTFEAPPASVVGANVTSQYNQGANGNLFSNGFGNSNYGGASGSGISEVPATYVVGQNVESQFTLGANANVYSNGFDNSISGDAIDSGISATFAVGTNVEYNLGGNKKFFSSAFDNRNSEGASGSGISEGLPRSVVANVESQYDLGKNTNVFSNHFDNSHSGGASGSGLSEQLATVDVFGIPVESLTAATDSVPSRSNGGLEDLAHHVLNSSDLEGDNHHQENFDNSQTVRVALSAGEDAYANNSWLENMLETDSNISMGNYSEEHDVFSYGR